MADYGPVSCAVLDNLELLTIRKTPCRIHYRDDDSGTSVAEGVIADFPIADGAEYLVFEDNPVGVRLDAITHIQVAGQK